jgi:hypothetical protein
MTPPKNSKPKALRRPVIDTPELPDDPWKAEWKRREPGPTQLAGTGRWDWRGRHHPKPMPGAESPPQNPPETAPE